MIRVEALHKHFGSIHALDGLDLQVESGAVFGFLGPNGAGKTTTLRLLAGLARPTSGRLSVAGIDPSTDRSALTPHIGYLPEEPAFYPWWTPLEFLDYLGKLHRMAPSIRLTRIQQTLEQVGLAQVAKRYIRSFSRGMRQRLGLAAALLHQPEVLLLDEPLSALDPLGRKEVLELIGCLRGRCTVLMSTHILADVERVCDTIGIIARGRMLIQSPRPILLERYAHPLFEIEVANGSEADLSPWVETWKDQDWVREVSLSGNLLRVAVKDLTQGRYELLEAILTHRLAVRRLEETRPSLEEIFLHVIHGENRP